ncbi:hypothetical protein [Brevibacterium sp.]|uniref:hypothetical protein n=1 Tax=Brevibacterium sp. TaxID=1701 RepID=UPI0028111D1B|nr:hypothetical protein [Brevibacterium sp.]
MTTKLTTETSADDPHTIIVTADNGTHTNEIGRIISHNGERGFQPAIFSTWGLRPDVLRALADLVDEAGLSPVRPHNPWATATEMMTMWFDETHWYPFVEDENCMITGPGHQDKQLFVAMVNRFDKNAAGDESIDELSAEDVSHKWVTIIGDEEPMFMPCSKETEGAVPVTCIWGVR